MHSTQTAGAPFGSNWSGDRGGCEGRGAHSALTDDTDSGTIIRTANEMTTPSELARLLLETMPVLGQSIGRTMRPNKCSHAGSDINVLIHVRTLHTLQDGPKAFQELLAFRGVAPATLSRSIDAMARHGWIERVPHPDDKRQVLLQATKAGRDYFMEIVSNSHAQLMESMQSLSPGELNTIATALTLLRRTLPQ